MEPAIFRNDDEGRAGFKELAERAVSWIVNYYKLLESFPVRSQVSPGEIYDQFPTSPPASPVSTDEVFRILDDVIIPGITHWQHPNFYAFFPGNTSFPSIAAEMLTSGIAAQCMLWESSPAAAELEQRCMEWCRDLLGLPEKWQGAIQDTASTATLTSLLTAREWKSDFKISTKGFDGKVYRIYASSQAHSSIEKAVRLAGFGTENLVKVNVDDQLSMDAEHLEKVIQQDIALGYIPACIVSTIGTTATCAIDPIQSVSDIAGRYNIWHHVDAAYAGTALMLDEYSFLRKGLEGADSFVFNPHKWMFVQFDCTAYFVKDPSLLRRTMSITPSYLSTIHGDKVNDYRDWGIPLGRRFRALKLWMTFQLLGTDAIKARLRHHISLAKKVEDLIKKDSRLEMAGNRSLNIITFRIKTDLDQDGSRTRLLSQKINESGKAYLTHATVEDRSLIRWVTGQTYVEERHIDDTWNLIQHLVDEISGYSVAQSPTGQINFYKMTIPTKSDLIKAHMFLEGTVHHTPVLTSTSFDEMTGCNAFFKCENFQRMGAFKMRGAVHAISKIYQDELSKGVITHSSGNFAQALALAARIKHIDATIVMPKDSPKAKIEAVRGYGGKIEFSGSKPTDREKMVNEIVAATGMHFIHPSNDMHVILGNSTATQELFEKVSGLDIVIVPVGGGGLLAGTALAAHWFSPATVVWAAEPENADDAFRSLQSGEIELNETADTVADGLRTNLGDVNFPIIKKLVEQVLLVSEEEIISAMRWVWERMKIIIEPSSAVAVAAVIRYKDQFEGKRVGVIISGGNVDLVSMLGLFKS